MSSTRPVAATATHTAPGTSKRSRLPPCWGRAPEHRQRENQAVLNAALEVTLTARSPAEFPMTMEESANDVSPSAS